MFFTGTCPEDSICLSNNVTVIFGHTGMESQGLSISSLSVVSPKAFDRTDTFLYLCISL